MIGAFGYDLNGIWRNWSCLKGLSPVMSDVSKTVSQISFLCHSWKNNLKNFQFQKLKFVCQNRKFWNQRFQTSYNFWTLKVAKSYLFIFNLGIFTKSKLVATMRCKTKPFALGDVCLYLNLTKSELYNPLVYLKKCVKPP